MGCIFLGFGFGWGWGLRWILWFGAWNTTNPTTPATTTTTTTMQNCPICSSLRICPSQVLNFCSSILFYSIFCSSILFYFYFSIFSIFIFLLFIFFSIISSHSFLVFVNKTKQCLHQGFFTRVSFANELIFNYKMTNFIKKITKYLKIQLWK